ncbi:uncharacterized mitochondrial protein AtMg00810-like [Rutidosis leptorrhynchoides]|uniref:uncharacterized mitochondrial protein AtMg00810-like n=1 Tax=Rutidosis leptorrhynchoides TaxID=125765 RepID=UPI003A997C68
MTDLIPLNYFLGIYVTHTPSGMFLSQKKYAYGIIEHANMVGCNSSHTLIDIETKLTTAGPLVKATLYRNLAMLSSISLLLGLTSLMLSIISAGSPSTRLSTSGYCVYLGNNLLSLSFKQQQTPSRSSVEAEYCSVRKRRCRDKLDS